MKRLKLAASVVLAFGSATGAFAQDSLTVVSWGGAYTKSQVEAYHKPFEKLTGMRIVSADYLGGLAEIKAQVQSGNISWDVVDLELPDAVRGCDEGLFEKVDIAKLPAAPDGTGAEADFLPGSLQPCAVGSVIWSSIYAFNDNAFPGEKPASVADFFDVKKFPGKRGFRKSPRTTLEMALMADGVPSNKVYEVLGTEEGVERAFAKLSTIKNDIVWWDANAQAPQMLNDGQVVMTAASSGRIFDAQVIEKRPFTIVWDGQILSMQLFGVVKGTPRKEKAMEFVAFATGTKALADQASWISYGPLRKSSMALVGKHATTGIEMAPNLPTAAGHLVNALNDDFEFWADHQDELNERFQTWLAK
ncbi:ABC transporter substrate-binding protein [Mesorhizobium sp. M0751]|uniref:ABC transporter substrate-binding protein n=1 Tax=unclassified Mesorhizobium TaxID=325217 RepID=UPI003334EA63